MAADRIFGNIEDSQDGQQLLEDLKNRQIDPFSAAEYLVRGFVPD
jgi:hypothetical protein